MYGSESEANKRLCVSERERVGMEESSTRCRRRERQEEGQKHTINVPFSELNFTSRSVFLLLPHSVLKEMFQHIYSSDFRYVLKVFREGEPFFNGWQPVDRPNV